MKLRAIILDFNGVIVDDEYIHFELFQTVLAEEGISLSEEAYKDKYLSMDDYGCFRAVLEKHGRLVDEQLLKELIRRKSELYKQRIQEEIVIFPGVVEFVKIVAQKYPLAVASGALRSEIEFVLQKAGIRQEFKVIVSAEDVKCFLKALELINITCVDPSNRICPQECLVIEDSVDGIIAAKTAGMKCLAVSNTFPPEKLISADLVIGSLEGCGLYDVEQLFNHLER